MTKTTKAKAIKKALGLCGGDYQRAIVLGQARLSGADLRGKARRYGARYAESRAAILRRMTNAGVPWHEARGAHNRRILVIGS